MAKNRPIGDNSRRGSVRSRTQFKYNGVNFKRNAETGRIMAGKIGPWKGIAQEPDGRRKTG